MLKGESIQQGEQAVTDLNRVEAVGQSFSGAQGRVRAAKGRPLPFKRDSNVRDAGDRLLIEKVVDQRLSVMAGERDIHMVPRIRLDRNLPDDLRVHRVDADRDGVSAVRIRDVAGDRGGQPLVEREGGIRADEPIEHRCPKSRL